MAIRFHRLDWGLGLLTVLLAAAGISAGVVVLQQERHLTTATRYNAVFDINQSATQVARLEADVAAALVPGSGVSADDAGFRNDIVATRLGVLQVGEPRALLERQPDSPHALASFAHVVAGLKADRSPAQLLASLQELRRLDAPMARMASFANETAGELVHASQVQLAETYWSVLAILIFMIGSGFALVGVVLRRSFQASKAARTDALTGLGNRRALYDLFDALAAGQGSGTGMALLLMDLDRFKAVNDTLGHAAGDDLLVEVARRVERQPEKARLVARLGGDEFAIVLLGRDASARAAVLARQICSDIRQPITIAKSEVTVGVSIGIATSETLVGAPLDLLRNADLALYAGKNERRGGWRFYEPEMQEREWRRQALEGDLREALVARQFELWFQPIVDVASGRTVGSEALIRWRHPARGLVSPAEFIPVAEEIGLIEAIGLWVLEEACATAAAWPADIRVSVNLSAPQLQSERLVDQMLGAMRRSGLPPSRLEVEVTESMLIEDVERVCATLNELRRSGLKIALDDFGTGYASLSYIDRFPIDKIKIDQSFVRSLTTKSSSAAVVKAVTVLAKDLGIVVAAEGVETADHLAQVRAAGCREAQGYFFARPLPAADFAALLDEQRLQEVA